MKKSIKHLSKSTLAVVLSLCMLISCASVGILSLISLISVQHLLIK